MTFGQSPNATLDAIIRKARYLLISFDGPIRSVETGHPAPNMTDVLTACRESGRFAAVVATTLTAEVRPYLDSHSLSAQITIVVSSFAEAVSALGASPAECAAVTSSLSDIEAVRAAGIPAIAYAKTLDDAEHLVHSGATAFVYSMTDLALRIRASS